MSPIIPFSPEGSPDCLRTLRDLLVQDKSEDPSSNVCLATTSQEDPGPASPHSESQLSHGYIEELGVCDH